MRQASKRIPDSAEKTVRDIRRATRRRSKARSGSPAIGRTGRAEQQRCRRKALRSDASWPKVSESDE